MDFETAPEEVRSAFDQLVSVTHVYGELWYWCYTPDDVDTVTGTSELRPCSEMVLAKYHTRSQCGDLGEVILFGTPR